MNTFTRQLIYTLEYRYGIKTFTITDTWYYVIRNVLISTDKRGNVSKQILLTETRLNNCFHFGYSFIKFKEQSIEVLKLACLHIFFIIQTFTLYLSNEKIQDTWKIHGPSIGLERKQIWIFCLIYNIWQCYQEKQQLNITLWYIRYYYLITSCLFQITSVKLLYAVWFFVAL